MKRTRLEFEYSKETFLAAMPRMHVRVVFRRVLRKESSSLEGFFIGTVGNDRLMIARANDGELDVLESSTAAVSEETEELGPFQVLNIGIGGIFIVRCFSRCHYIPIERIRFIPSQSEPGPTEVICTVSKEARTEVDNFECIPQKRAQKHDSNNPKTQITVQ